MTILKIISRVATRFLGRGTLYIHKNPHIYIIYILHIVLIRNLILKFQEQLLNTHTKGKALVIFHFPNLIEVHVCLVIL